MYQIAGGHTVRIRHYRLTDTLATSLIVTHNRLRDLGPRVAGVGSKYELRRKIGDRISPTGGFTVAEIVQPDGEEIAVLARGEACCRADEPFNRAVGREVAIGRALKQMGSLKPEVKDSRLGEASLAFMTELEKLMHDFNLSFEELKMTPEEAGAHAAALVAQERGLVKKVG